jgi:hypothetical protein
MFFSLLGNASILEADNSFKPNLTKVKKQLNKEEIKFIICSLLCYLKVFFFFICLKNI